MSRVVLKFGDDPASTRPPDGYANAKSRRNYAGTSPITRASETAGRIDAG